MNLSDEEFREAYKPIPVVAHFSDAITTEEKIIYALGQIGEGTTEEVTEYLWSLTDEKPDTSEILQKLFESGRITGRLIDGERHYDLSKITESNDGAVNPELLAPGLD